MSASDIFENDNLKLIFNNVAIAGIADAVASAGSLYVSLHTADPGEAGTQSNSEAAYTGYVRVAVARTPAGWTVVGNEASNTAQISFPARTNVGTATVTHVGLGTGASGAGKLLYSLALSEPSSIAVTQGIAPGFAAGELVITLD